METPEDNNTISPESSLKDKINSVVSGVVNTVNNAIVNTINTVKNFISCIFGK
ncbi:hypothetical protein [Clostridium sp. DSM 8431]|uniref:hypothetical protein n=1 Tax=Clostridium sp. DSM 8431 TaxID=1761781 RepID=UPI001587A6EC|nr:hypothetical protein [Clostridium sp. DSM 8431]